MDAIPPQWVDASVETVESAPTVVHIDRGNPLVGPHYMHAYGGHFHGLSGSHFTYWGQRVRRQDHDSSPVQT